MSGLFSQFVGGESDGDTDVYTSYDTYEPAYIPEPGPTLAPHCILTGEDHIEFHQKTRELFEERGVYDMTFGYNLAKLNLDTRHPDAGFRYAIGAEDENILHAEFTPTTPFCPQSDTLSIGSFRAWNGLSERHEFDVVSVSVAEMHHRSDNINAELKALEREFLETGTVPDAAAEVDSMQAPVEQYPTPDEQSDAPF